MSSSRVQITLTGLPSFFDRIAASAQKSGFDLRPNPPPSSVTLQMTSFLSMPSASRHGVLRRLRILLRTPDGDLAVAEVRHCGGRLHRGVRQQRRVVRRLEYLAALGELGVDVADVPRHLTRLRHRRDQFLLEALGLEARVRAVRPLHLELLPTLHRRPGVVRNHRNAAERLEPVRQLQRLERDGLTNALHRQRRLVVDAADGAAEHRRTLDHGVHHAVAEHVETELRLAGENVGLVVGRPLFADELPRRLRLELQLADLRAPAACWPRPPAVHNRRGGCSPDAPPRGWPSSAAPTGTFHCAAAALSIIERADAPGVTEGLVEVADRSRAVGVLIAVTGITHTLLDADARPVGVELVGRHHRQRRPDARAHFRAVGDDEYRAVGFDAEIDTGIERSPRRRECVRQASAPRRCRAARVRPARRHRPRTCR